MPLSRRLSFPARGYGRHKHRVLADWLKSSAHTYAHANHVPTEHNDISKNISKIRTQGFDDPVLVLMSDRPNWRISFFHARAYAYACVASEDRTWVQWSFAKYLCERLKILSV